MTEQDPSLMHWNLIHHLHSLSSIVCDFIVSINELIELYLFILILEYKIQESIISKITKKVQQNQHER